MTRMQRNATLASIFDRQSAYHLDEQPRASANISKRLQVVNSILGQKLALQACEARNCFEVSHEESSRRNTSAGKADIPWRRSAALEIMQIAHAQFHVDL